MHSKLLSIPLFVALILTGCSKSEPAAVAAPSGPRTIDLTAGDNMKYNLTQIEAAPGEVLHVTLTNGGTLPKEAMGHDWILLRAGTDPEAYSRAAVMAKDANYQPPALAFEVLASIPLLGPGQTGDVTFNAPTQPGEYPFLCSFPAHCQSGMKGILVVH
ncbi:MAG TPA: plastocyanin/azurin family copper-binding protein [Opitutaceae bacterium]|jgi:azurin|nr:plastocyanin/azurin family copper-binding protein [Opitutaceae bacterium]